MTSFLFIIAMGLAYYSFKIGQIKGFRDGNEERKDRDKRNGE